MIKDIYYWFYRLWAEWNPRHVYRRMKWFIQRGMRGYSDRDVWGLDSYLAGWLPNALRQLRDTKHGIPADMFTEEEFMAEDPDGSAMKRAETKWNYELKKMIDGFEAFDTIMSVDVTKEQEEVCMKVFRDGMDALRDHFWDLWD